jgi:hypothetical protein
MSENEQKSLAKQDLGGAIANASDMQNIEMFRRRMENFTARLNRPPDKAKVQNRTEAGQTYDYIPVSIIENDLRKYFFGLVQLEIIDYKLVVNEIICTARIKVFHPVLMQWLNYDGIGSGVLQQDSNTSLTDFMQHKKKNAAKLAAPIAYAEAIKNAAKKIGKRFGSDLNRKHEDFYAPTYKDDPDSTNKPLN